jgi:hypothetical protein
MVPYTPPKSKRSAKRDLEAKASLYNLADELLLELIRYLDTQDILKVRLTSNCLVGACNSVIQARCKTLYIHPTHTPLRQVQEICAHAFLGKHIEEVILLGRPSLMWPRIWFAQHANPRPAYLLGRDLERSDSLLPGEPWANRFRSWPLILQKTGEERKTSSNTTDSEVTGVDYELSFDEAYEPLISALFRLPKLHKIAFAEQVSQDSKGASLNQVKQCVINSNAERWAQRLCDHSVVKNTNFRRPASRRSDVGVLYGLLTSRRLHFDSFRVECELPFMDAVFVQPDGRHGAIISPLSLSLTEGLQKLDLTLDSGWEANYLHYSYYGLIRHSKSTLKSLRIVYFSNARYTKPTVEDTLSSVICNTDMPVLENLAIEYGNADPIFHGPCCDRIETLSNSKQPTKAYRPIRPLCQHFDFIKRFKSILNTIKTITFKNVIFDEFEMRPSTDGIVSTRRNLEYLRRHATKLENLQWTIGHFRHHQLCKRSDDEPVVRCNQYECGIYTTYGISTPQFEMFVNELGVTLDKVRQEWDFGQYMMKLVEERKRFEAASLKVDAYTS